HVQSGTTPEHVRLDAVGRRGGGGASLCAPCSRQLRLGGSKVSAALSRWKYLRSARRSSLDGRRQLVEGLSSWHPRWWDYRVGPARKQLPGILLSGSALRSAGGAGTVIPAALTVLIFGFVTSLTLTPVISRLATRHGWLDRPD